MSTSCMIDAAANERRDASLEFLRELIAAQRQGESAVQSRVATALRAAGCSIENVKYRPLDVPMVAEFASSGAVDAGIRTSTVGRLAGSGGGRSLIFFAHPDGEPVAGIDRWRHDPFVGKISHGRIYGWGVADDLAGVAIMVEAVACMRAAGLAPKGDVIVASTPSKRHARGVSALLHGGMSADAAVYLHPAESGAGMREIKAFASGLLEFRITVRGRPADTTEPIQTAFAHTAVNPILKAARILRALEELDVARGARVQHPELERMIGRSTNISIVSVSAGAPDSYWRVPESCMLYGTVSFPPPEALATVQSEIEAAVRVACSGDAWLEVNPPRIDWVSGVTGAEVRSDHPLFRAVASEVRTVTGTEPYVNPLHTSSDIRNPIVQKGIPTVGLGPLCGDLAQNGHADEWVDVEDYLRAVRAAARTIVSWCGAAGD